MVQPINYMLDVQNPVQTAMTGLTQGMQIGQFMQAKEQAEREAIQKQQMQQELSAFASKPNKTHDDYANIMAKYPALAEDFKRSYDVLDSGKQQSTFKTASRIYAATASKRFDLAKSILETEAVGYENSGDKETAGYLRQMATMAETDPEGLQALTGLTLASTNPSQFKDVLGALNQNDLTPQEINLKKAQTEKTETETLWYGDKTQAEINNLESQVEDRKIGRVLENKKIENENAQFYANLDQGQKQFLMRLDQDERKLANELNPTKPEKSEDRIARLGKVEDYEAAVSNANNAAKNAGDLAKDFSKISESTGGYWNKAMRNIPGTDEHAFNQKLETLKSQVFLTQVEKMKGMGALTDAEGARLEKSIDSLDADLDPKVLQKNLRNIESELKRAATKAQKMAELYATRGTGYSDVVIEAAKQRGVTPYEMQKIANEQGY